MKGQNEIKYTCPCSRDRERDVWYNLVRVLQEVWEFLIHPCSDEWSDIWMNVSCLCHAINPNWVRLFSWGVPSQMKGLKRYDSYGCCRSQKNANRDCLVARALLLIETETLLHVKVEGPDKQGFYTATVVEWEKLANAGVLPPDSPYMGSKSLMQLVAFVRNSITAPFEWTE